LHSQFGKPFYAIKLIMRLCRSTKYKSPATSIMLK